ncbi:unnamed protein product [Parnassius apollo]|uniref:(apollo) hypothetical protein n=1 Tax=Parnassius apollo TaxID=110799 RepID=A0A8S3YC93_PARAO|nr:unnamed protein product [Parnassius apollo]
MQRGVHTSPPIRKDRVDYLFLSYTRTNTVQRTPPPTTPPTQRLKYSSNRKLPETCGADDNTFVSLRKRKQPDDINVKAVLEFVEQKINDQLSSWKLQLDITIAESIRNSIDTVIDRELKKISATISNSFNELGDILDTINKSLSYTMERQDSIETRLTQVESQLRSSDDVTSQVNLLQDKIDAMEQQARLYNVEITNLPERRDENLLSIIEKIGCVIKHPGSKSDIVSAHRVPHFDKKCSRPKNVVIKFTTKIRLLLHIV